MVQNQFIEVMLEIGVVGLFMFISFFAIIIILLIKHRLFWGIGIVVAFICQLLFFSGYPNSLHIFIILAFIYSYLRLLSSSPKNHRKNRLK